MIKFMESKITLELKYFCKDFNPIRTVLCSIGAKKESVKRQKDYFFNLPKDKNQRIPARLKLRVSNGKQSLIFYRRPKFSAKSTTLADVIVLPVKDKEIIPFLSKALRVKIIVEKQRELWRKGDIVFHLDRVKGIGNVFEIEVLAKPKTIKRDRLNFNNYKKKLLPFLNKIIIGSNEDLVLKLKK